MGTGYYREKFDNGQPELHDALNDAWNVEILDPVWGRHAYLFDELVAALSVGPVATKP